MATTQPIARVDNTPQGIGLAVLAMVVFAIHDAIAKLLTEDHSAPQILWIRAAFFALFALAIARRKRPLRKCFVSQRPGLQIIRGLMLVGDMLLIVIAFSLLPLADTHALVATFPLMVTAMSAVFLKEPVGLRRWLAVFACFIGVLIILRPGLTALQPGALLALGAAVFFAAYNTMTRVVSRYDSSETTLLYTAVVGLASTTLIGPFFWTWPSATGWALFVAVSIGGTLAHLLLISALERAPASVLQPFNYVLLLAATVVGFIVFGQFPDIWTIAGSAVIVCSGLYVIYRERKRQDEGTTG